MGRFLSLNTTCAASPWSSLSPSLGLPPQARCITGRPEGYGGGAGTTWLKRVLRALASLGGHPTYRACLEGATRIQQVAEAQKKRTRAHVNPGPKERTAATYSRASYTGTTIGNAAFDGRVRDGIGSDHCFIATEKCSRTSAPAVP